MASTWSDLKFELIGTGDQSGTWGTTTNANIGDAIEQAIGGKADVTMSSTSITISLTDTTALQDARALYLNLTGTPGGAATLNVPAVQKSYIVYNNTTGGFAVTVKVSGQTGVSVPNGKVMVLYDNGTDVVDAITHLSSLTLGSALAVASGGTGVATLTANNVVLGNGTSAVQFVAPGSVGNVLTSNGTTWTSSAPASTLSGQTDSASPYETALGSGAGAVTTGVNNTFVGFEAGNDNTTGTNNTAVGYQALDANTTGVRNVAVGSQSLGSNTTGVDITAVGQGAGFLTTGNQNTFVGSYSGQNVTTGTDNTLIGFRNVAESNSTGSYNTSVGSLALRNNTSASSNTALGYAALTANTTGADNTAVGYGALDANTTGRRNTAVGVNALGANTTASQNNAFGYNALAANTTGDALSAFGDFCLDVNTTGSYNVGMGQNVLGSNTTGSYNTALGSGALTANTTGANNVAVGAYALDANTTAQYNTAVGAEALGTANTGGSNTGIGYSALYSNTTGFNNVALGREALLYNVTGANNVAVGYQALYGVSTNSASNNTAIGYQALYANTTGANNTALGYAALFANTTGASNTAVGYAALDACTTGSNNVAVGANVLGSSTTGEFNTGVGLNAGFGVTTGTNNSFLGYDSGRASSPSGNVTTGSNIICLGNNSITDLYCADTTISSSDARDKTDVENFIHGLDWITQLRPVTYRWDKRAWYVGPDATTEDVINAKPDGSKKQNRLNIGFLAQEEIAVEKQFGYAETWETMLVAAENEDGSAFGLKYERLVPVLVNAIKELNTRLQAAEAEIATLKGA